MTFSTALPSIIIVWPFPTTFNYFVFTPFSQNKPKICPNRAKPIKPTKRGIKPLFTMQLIRRLSKRDNLAHCEFLSTADVNMCGPKGHHRPGLFALPRNGAEVLIEIITRCSGSEMHLKIYFVQAATASVCLCVCLRAVFFLFPATINKQIENTSFVSYGVCARGTRSGYWPSDVFVETVAIQMQIRGGGEGWGKPSQNNTVVI